MILVKLIFILKDDVVTVVHPLSEEYCVDAISHKQ